MVSSLRGPGASQINAAQQGECLEGIEEERQAVAVDSCQLSRLRDIGEVPAEAAGLPDLDAEAETVGVTDDVPVRVFDPAPPQGEDPPSR